MDPSTQARPRPIAIVSTVPAGTAIAFALGLGASVRGVTHECRHPLEAAACPRVLTCSFDADSLSSAEIDAAVKAAALPGAPPLYAVDQGVLEAAGSDGARVVVLGQDLCDVCGPAATLVASAIAALPPCDDRTLVTLRATTLAGLFADIVAVAAACDAPAAGSALVAELQARVRAVVASASAAAASGVPLPRVACIEWLDPLYNAGHWMPECVGLAGGSECWSGPGFSTGLPPTALRDAAPDVIIVMPCGFDLERTARDAAATLPQLPGWTSIPAVRSGRVWAIDGNRLFSGAAPALIDGVEVLAAIFHGTPEQRAAVIKPCDAARLEFAAD